MTEPTPILLPPRPPWRHGLLSEEAPQYVRCPHSRCDVVIGPYWYEREAWAAVQEHFYIRHTRMIVWRRTCFGVYY